MQEPTLPTDEGRGPRAQGRRRVALVLLLALALAPYFVGLGVSSIWDSNEAFYVETPQQMVLSGDYVNPTFNGQPRFNKPVLSYWVVAGFYHLFGIHVAVERLAIACGAMGIIAAAFVIGRLVYSTPVGLLAGIAIASAPMVLMWARRIMIDVYLALFMALTLMFYALAVARPERRRPYLLLMYAAAGLGVLTKGPEAVVLPALVWAGHQLWTRSGVRLRDLMLPWGALIVVVIVAPWYLAIYAQHGWKYIWDFFVGENLGRYTETVGYQDRGVFFYLPVLFTELFPWALLLPVAVYAAVKEYGARSGPAKAGPCDGPVNGHAVDGRAVDGPAVDSASGSDGLSGSDVEAGFSRPEIPVGNRTTLTRLLLVWIAVFVVVFTCSRTKQELYIFPIVPAVAVLLAGVLDGAWSRERVAWRGVAASFWVIACALLLLGLGLWRLFGPAATADRIAGAGAVGVLLAVGAVAAVVALARGRLAIAAATVAVVVIAANWAIVTVALPAFERYKPVVPMARLIESRASPDAVVAEYITALPSLSYYLGHPITPVYDMASLVKLARSAPELYVTMWPNEYDAFRARTAAPTCVLDRRRLFEAQIDAVLDGRPWPELWLIGVGRACGR